MIRGLAIGEYRSIGETQLISSLGKINLFVGPNNSGKSNILRFINDNLISITKCIHNGRGQFLAKPLPHLRRNKPSFALLGISSSLKAFEQLLKSNGHTHDPISKIYEKLNLDKILWLDDKWPNSEIVEQARSWITSQMWYNIWSTVSNQNGGGLTEHWIPETLRFIKQLTPSPLNVYAIPIDRQAGKESEIKSNEEVANILGGKSAIRSLAALQNPPYESFEEDRKRFANIEEFLRTVTDDSSAKISVPHKQDEILVQMKGQPYFPLSSLGSGIEQVVLHAVAATAAINAIVTFEEPELHLHPVLQRQLLIYLSKTSNQYFISTHSAHLIDALHADTFHVRLVQGETVIEQAATDSQRHQVCFDLGYRASDIVQANCIIWVEGPSDRIYLRHWLKQVDPHLSENVHFSIMFYGGKLLSHLSASETDALDDRLADLIQLRLLNRHIAVIIDSDIEKEGDVLRETKERVVNEIRKFGGLTWVTAGREIENYIPHKTLMVAVDVVAPGRGKFIGLNQYEKALPAKKPNSNQTVDKVAVAKQAAQLNCSLELFDLLDRINELTAFIRKCNGLPKVI